MTEYQLETAFSVFNTFVYIQFTEVTKSSYQVRVKSFATFHCT